MIMTDPVTKNPYDDLISTQDSVVHRMEVFEIEGQRIGPLMLVLNKATFEVRVYPEHGRDNLSWRGDVHPHVGGQGYICLGRDALPFRELRQSKANPAEMLFLTAQYLRNGYVAGDAYYRICDWKKPAEPPQVFVLNVRITDTNSSQVECWGIFNSYAAADARLGKTKGIEWDAVDGRATHAAGTPGPNCDDYFPGLVEAYATIDTHTVED